MDSAGMDRSVVFNQCVRDGLILGVITGAASGTAAAPVLGTIIGALVGLVLAVPVSLVVAAAVAPPARAPRTAPAFRRRIDVTFAVFALVVAALAVGWISLDPLVGAAPAVTMLIVIVLGLLLVRMRLRRLAPTSDG